MALGARGEALLDEIAAVLEQHAEELERGGLQSVSLFVNLDSGGLPHTTLYRAESRHVAKDAPRRRRRAA